ncbi:MAG TPA: energy transducer TonB [Flavobacterium sp.]|jgi:TonB family protein
MIKKFLLLLTLFICSISFAQEGELLSDTEDVYEADVISPKFDGGDLNKFYEFIRKEYDFSKSAKGKMIVSFTITASGDIANIRILQFKDANAAAELIRIIKKSPKWESAKRNGKPFSTEIKLPIEFKS